MADNESINQNTTVDGAVAISEIALTETGEQITQPSAENNPAPEYIPDQEENGDETIPTETQEGEKDMGEKNEDTPDEKDTPAYEAEDWQNKVEEFFRKYPVAKGFASMIGEQIVKDESLSHDDNCLEKALARIFDKVYVPPEELVKNDEFLEKYVYCDERIKTAIVEKYLEELENNRPPKAISSRGKITLTPPDRPKSIAEAGNVIKSMLKNRRI
ncbi:MAG: hypothetical protein K2O08_04815 [Clostridia bacterium]|nr:hypothetical protein [Clostridia bacterium]